MQGVQKMDKLQVLKRNYLLLTADGTFFFIGMAFLDASSVVPVFIDNYTGSLQLAGLAITIKTAASLLAQLLIGPYVSRIRYLPSFIIRIMFLSRPLPLLMVPVLLSNTDPYLIVGIFLFLFFLLWVSLGEWRSRRCSLDGCLWTHRFRQETRKTPRSPAAVRWYWRSGGWFHYQNHIGTTILVLWVKVFNYIHCHGT